MATHESELQIRIRRLEAVVAALLVSDRDVDPFLYDRLLERFPYPPPDEFYFLLREVARSRPYPGNRFREILAGLEERVGAVGESVARLQADSHTIFAIQSMGIELDRVRIPRFLPVRVYVDRYDPEAVEGLSRALDDVLRAFGLEIADDFPPQQGSWFKKWICRSKKVATSEEAIDIGRKIKRSIELVGMEKQQAEINETQARAVGTLVEQVKGFDNAAAQAGTALVVVTTDGDGRKNVLTATLTAAQVIALENNQKLLYSPSTLLAELKMVCDDSGSDGHDGGIVPSD